MLLGLYCWSWLGGERYDLAEFMHCYRSLWQVHYACLIALRKQVLVGCDQQASQQVLVGCDQQASQQGTGKFIWVHRSTIGEHAPFTNLHTSVNLPTI